jgi:hypothetical protein
MFAVGALLLSSHALAQWVTFDDETASRLELVNVGLFDDQEKDIAAADLDHDGWTDLLVVRKRPFSNPGARVDVLLMNQEGVLVDMTNVYAPGFDDPTDARDVLIVDVDNDGWEDVVVSTVYSDPLKLYRNLGLSDENEWLGLADESERFGAIGAQSLPIMYTSVAAGDIDDDGWVDLYFSSHKAGDDLLYMNNGDGTFSDQTVARLGDLATSAFGTRNAIEDIDADGDLDIIKLTSLFFEPPFEIGLYVLWNDGSGHFSEFVKVPDTNSPYDFATGDLDGDGSLDVYVIQDSQDGYAHIVPNGAQELDFSEYFTPIPSPRTTGFGGSTFLADVDADGDLDVGVGPIDTDIFNCHASVFALLENDGQGMLSDPWPENDDQNFHLSSHDHVALDVNNDGCLDLFMGLCGDEEPGWAVLIQTDCEGKCVADFNTDGDLNILDFVAFQGAFVDGDPGADVNGDGKLNILDFVTFQILFQAGC